MISRMWVANLILLLLASGAQAQILPSLQDLSATRERPLFSQNRRPPPPPALALPPPPPTIVAAPEAPPPSLLLSGVILSDRQSMALIRRPTDAKLERVGVGQYVDGWMVAQIESRRILLVRGDRESWVEMLEPRR